ncbi:hypothetical protein C2G38_2158386 [Gigaspora rosea]|uniref:Uncharacterized protein n=1 Tax=Gigaspora rosea TaxID=44941 RepID=A0A397W2K1_9GLOM|nr:hypothetical protein C2G38_2158386 [Gigaspora rosea]
MALSKLNFCVNKNNKEHLDSIGLMCEDTDIEDIESSILADNTDSLNCSEISSQSSTILKSRNQFVLQSESLAIV